MRHGRLRHIVNPQQLTGLYGRLPELSERLRVRSFTMDWRGPTLTLRVDLPEFPAEPPQEWRDAGFDTVQCHLQYLAVEQLAVRLWTPPAVGDLAVSAPDAFRRLRVRLRGAGVDMTFGCSDSVLVGHVSAFTRVGDGSDPGPRSFVNRVDTRRHSTLPEPWERSYFEQL
ncbi:immunity protein 50 of polymorphic toxin system [Streptomyces sp. BK022]|uniref:Imm50 family immunity protein n=1 Tax=Streptomyces sp. BK022 TaxID=2512123 RepID=UPI00102A0C4F|nr:Imm50 family immunity protein [Streptomyces sp. BK022]RZU37344.1 immunity protein 50 of polymorphic toxin system [Streptomyces sp. BK022]